MAIASPTYRKPTTIWSICSDASVITSVAPRDARAPHQAWCFVARSGWLRPRLRACGLSGPAIWRRATGRAGVGFAAALKADATAELCGPASAAILKPICATSSTNLDSRLCRSRKKLAEVAAAEAAKHPDTPVEVWATDEPRL